MRLNQPNSVFPVGDRYEPMQENGPSQSAQHYDVTIVGGGIVGLTLACALEHSGLSVAVVEAQPPEQGAAMQRAYAFSLLSSQIFKGLGLWDAIAPTTTPFQTVQLSDADHPQVVRFQREELGTDAVCYAAEHGTMMATLQARVAQSPTLHYLCPAQVIAVVDSPEAVHVTIQRQGELQMIHTQLIVAADGSRSRLRSQADIETFGWQYQQACITAVVKPEHSHANTAYERFWPSGPFAILPLTDNRCQIVWTASRAEAETILTWPHERFMAELTRRYGDQMGQLELITEPRLFQVQLMQSRQYVKSRLALVGDAAHCCHPVGGQGLNMGIRDAAALAQVLTQAHHRGHDIGALRTLKQYERWRQRENWLILGLTDVLNRSFSNQVWWLKTLRRLGIYGLKQIPPLRQMALHLMIGFFGRRPKLAQR